MSVPEQFSAVSKIFDVADMVLYVADMETHELLFMNQHAEQVWGADWHGKRCFAVLQAQQSAPCSFCTNDRLMHGGRAGPAIVWEFQNTLNKRWYLCIDKAIPWADGRTVRMEVAIDITERKEHEAFREQYLGLISHDLRSPLSTVTVAASMLKVLLANCGHADGARHAEMILRNTHRMADMLDDLLETTQLESGQMALRVSRFNLDDLAGSVVTQFANTTSRAIELHADGPAPVLADAGRLERVLENLVDNAARYSQPDMPVAVRIATHASEVVLTVVDRGIGIPPEELPKLFQRFYRATSTRAIRGLGLGLYNSRLIVESHGGRIWVDSLVGSGSTFGFALPLRPTNAL